MARRNSNRLPAPQRLTVTPGDGHLVLDWAAVEGAEGYRLRYRRARGGSFGNPIKIGRTTEHRLVGLANGTRYVLRLCAVSGTGDRGPNAIATGQPKAPLLSFGAARVADHRLVQRQRMAPVVLPEAAGASGAVAYSLSPPLPAGLAFNPATREISGTPAESLEKTDFILTAEADGRRTRLPFTLAVEADGRPDFGGAAVGDLVFEQGRLIPETVLPAASGGEGRLIYRISPRLPAGLSFDSETRTLSGTPAESLAGADYMLTVYDSDGNQSDHDCSTLQFRITVRNAHVPDAPSNLTVGPNASTGQIGVSWGQLRNGEHMELIWRSNDETEFSPLATSSESGFQISELDRRKGYVIRGRVVNSKGHSSWVEIDVPPADPSESQTPSAALRPRGDDDEDSGGAHGRTAITLEIEGDDAPTVDELKIYHVHGSEAISRLSRFEINLVRIQNDVYREIAPETVLGHNARLDIQVLEGGNTAMPRTITGIISAFREIPSSGMEVTHYRLQMEPSMSALGRNRQSRVHATASASDVNAVTFETLIKNKLLAQGTDYKKKNDDDMEREMRSFLFLEGVEFCLSEDKLPQNSFFHVTQYEESDLNFICRLCENHGVFFFFKNDDNGNRDIVVFGNADTAITKHNENFEIKLVNKGTTGTTGDSRYVVNAETAAAKVLGNLITFERVCKPHPRLVRLVSNNAEKPSLKLIGECEIDSSGKGIQSFHDTHFTTTDQGKAFAELRAEEIMAECDYWEGKTTTPCIAPGRIMTRLEHTMNWRTASGKDYLITESEFEMFFGHDGVRNPDGQTVETSFVCNFRCIVHETGGRVFRPRRSTPVPRLAGVYSASVDGVAGKEIAQRGAIDDDGAYRVVYRHDERAELTAGKNSKALKKAEPYAGEAVGMHFPLKEGTEVLVAFRNGDPDCPVIVGAMPNGDHPSPVTASNRSAHRIITNVGGMFEINDGDTSNEGDLGNDANTEANTGERLIMKSRQGATGSYIRMGHPDPANESVYETAPFPLCEDVNAGMLFYTPNTIMEVAPVKKSQANDIDSCALDRYLISGGRMLIHAGLLAGEGREKRTLSEVPSEDGDLFINAVGNLSLVAGGDIIEDAQNKNSTVKRNSHKTVLGYDSKIVLGLSNSVLVGLKTSVKAAGGVSISLSADLKMTLGTSASISMGAAVSLKIGGYASIGIGVGLSVKPSVAINNYTGLKIEKVAVAEIKDCPLNLKTHAVNVDTGAIEAKAMSMVAQSSAARMTISGFSGYL